MQFIGHLSVRVYSYIVAYSKYTHIAMSDRFIHSSHLLFAASL